MTIKELITCLKSWDDQNMDVVLRDGFDPSTFNYLARLEIIKVEGTLTSRGDFFMEEVKSGGANVLLLDRSR